MQAIHILQSHQNGPESKSFHNFADGLNRSSALLEKDSRPKPLDFCELPGLLAWGKLGKRCRGKYEVGCWPQWVWELAIWETCNCAELDEGASEEERFQFKHLIQCVID